MSWKHTDWLWVRTPYSPTLKDPNCPFNTTAAWRCLEFIMVETRDVSGDGGCQAADRCFPAVVCILQDRQLQSLQELQKWKRGCSVAGVQRGCWASSLSHGCWEVYLWIGTEVWKQTFSRGGTFVPGQENSPNFCLSWKICVTVLEMRLQMSIEPQI